MAPLCFAPFALYFGNFFPKIGDWTSFLRKLTSDHLYLEEAKKYSSENTCTRLEGRDSMRVSPGGLG